MTSLIIAAAIGISSVDPHYFADANGKTWVPVGYFDPGGGID